MLNLLGNLLESLHIGGLVRTILITGSPLEAVAVAAVWLSLLPAYLCSQSTLDKHVGILRS
jgi:hypothetical protein